MYVVKYKLQKYEKFVKYKLQKYEKYPIVFIFFII